MENLPSKQQEKPTLQQMIIAKSSKIEIIQQYNSLTIGTIVKSNFPSIGQIKREYGAEIVTNCLGVLYSDLSTSFEGALSTDQIEELIAETSSGLLCNHSLESIYVILQRIKRQDKFGKLTVNRVLKAMDEGFEELQQAHMDMNYNKHLANKFHDPIEKRRSEQDKALDHQARLMYQKSKNK